MKRANRSACKTLPDPESKEQLGFEAMYSSAEAERLRQGLIPLAMEDATRCRGWW